MHEVVIVSAQGQLGGVFEVGTIVTIHPETGERRCYNYFGYGLGLGAGGSVGVHGGLMDIPDGASLSGAGLEVNASAAMGYGKSFQYSGSGPRPSAYDVTGGGAVGSIYGIGLSTAGMGTWTWEDKDSPYCPKKNECEQ
jgi:hypothetical protein